MNQDDVVIIGAKRTPIGKFKGVYSNVPAPMLAAKVVQALVNDLDHVERVDQVILGNVLSAGIGQAPARQAWLKAGYSHSVPAVTLNKMCGSGLYAVQLAYHAILAAQAECVVAGGMENMTLAPYLLPKARTGFRLGHQEVLDHMFHDGLEDVYHPGALMGTFADKTAKQYSISRSQQDEFATLSLMRSQEANTAKLFADEIVSVDVEYKKQKQTITEDECPLGMDTANITRFKPAFDKDGTVTAANASAIADGASALTIMRADIAKELGHQSLAKIVGMSTFAQAPEWFTTAPVFAIKKLLKQINWSTQDVDLYEINEAFAVVTLFAINELKLDVNRVNVNGGACALGHPVGATGARILVTLMHALAQRQLTKGVACLCIGGGEAIAIAIEITEGKS